MLKRKIGAGLCLLSGILAFAIYIIVINGYSEHLLALQSMRFGSVYYPLLIGLDLILLLCVCMKSYTLNRLVGAERSMTGLERAVLSKWPEACVFLLCTLLNVYFAVQANRIYTDDIVYTPIMLVKALTMLAVYLVHTALSFADGKKAARIVALIAIPVMLVFSYRLVDAACLEKNYMSASEFIGLFVSSVVPRVAKLFGSNNTLIAAATVLFECLLAIMRLIGLSLYDTKLKLKGV
ncbi:MAG: hypothetical protein II875_14265 [Clostridia bacterium]|nr:hypothetical protein [Clostridia bacterium]